MQQDVGASGVLPQPFDDRLVVALGAEHREIVRTSPVRVGERAAQLVQVHRVGDGEVFGDDVRQRRHLGGHAVRESQQKGDPLEADLLVAGTAADPVVAGEEVQELRVTDVGSPPEPVQQGGHPVRRERPAQLFRGRPQFSQEARNRGCVGELLVPGQPAVAEPPADQRLGRRVPQRPLDQRLALLREDFVRPPQRPGVRLGPQ
ncbi:hypothetical protein ABZ372_25960 [Streptomyces sp. NPDC005921]